jgi:ERCC4-type nuclease
MNLKIDTREHELFKKCQDIILMLPKFKDIQLVSITLPLGDIIINDGSNDCVIIERKTLTDLAASIKDGRYEEQSYRLNGIQHHNHNIMYLIEGDINRFNTFKERIDKQTLYSAMVSINYFKGFSVMRTTSLEETAMLVCNMAYKLVKETKTGRQGYYSNITTNIKPIVVAEDIITDNDESNKTELDIVKEEKEYCSVVKKVKKENITENNIGEIMLCQIPGVSSASALAILAHFKTLPVLINAIQENNTCLNNICTIDANGKPRKISKTTIATIIKYLNT